MNELGYISLIEKVLSEGTMEETRNGKTKSLFGEMMRFSLQNNQIPFITTKKLAWKTCLKELLWFINGSTDNSDLVNNNVNIWTGNAEEYKDRMEKEKNIIVCDGDLGPVYGHQWRHFNADYFNCKMSYENKGVDQLREIINTLKDPEKRTSRRIILSAWNPCQIPEMALPPCHILCQFHVSNKNRLHCCLYQRSGDIGLGVPFNIASYSFLTHIIAKICGLEAYEFTHFLGNAHIYEEHINALREQCKKEIYSFPTINFKREIKDIDEVQFSDIEILNYNHHPPVKMDMKV
tara:strand:- start:13038 stop:13913 length:876 start_codon:yes stop_codon:yes gene_type:complete